MRAVVLNTDPKELSPSGWVNKGRNYAGCIDVGMVDNSSGTYWDLPSLLLSSIVNLPIYEFIGILFGDIKLVEEPI